jgi:hypothetical protein
MPDRNDPTEQFFATIAKVSNKLFDKPGGPGQSWESVFRFVYDENAKGLGFDRIDKRAFEELIKTAVVGNPCASCTPIPNLMRMYISRFPEGELELIEWIYENRTNGYDPFGREPWGAKSFRERAEMSVRYAEVQQREADDRLRQQQEGKKKRLSLTATRTLANAIRRGDIKAVKVLIPRHPDIQKVSAEVGMGLVAWAEENNRDEVAEYLREAGISE